MEHARNLLAALWRAAGDWPERPAVVARPGGRGALIADLAAAWPARVAAVAAGMMAAAGVLPGDRVGVIGAAVRGLDGARPRGPRRGRRDGPDAARAEHRGVPPGAAGYGAAHGVRGGPARRHDGRAGGEAARPTRRRRCSCCAKAGCGCCVVGPPGGRARSVLMRNASRRPRWRSSTASAAPAAHLPRAPDAAQRCASPHTAWACSSASPDRPHPRPGGDRRPAAPAAAAPHAVRRAGSGPVAGVLRTRAAPPGGGG
ncbi:hypothetical protein ACU686_21275 [Yinghuangia aomiensis]